MKQMKKSHRSREDTHALTEDIDYSKTGKSSIWGTGDKATLALLRKTKLRGIWLNLAAGDGRYTKDLLTKVDSLVVSDIDESALAKLWRNTPLTYRKKLELKPFDITKRFPLANNSFDGVFCTGTLHLFPRRSLRRIIAEIDRVLKPNGKVVIDFAVDISRTSLNGNGRSIIFGKEPLYTLKEAIIVLKTLFRDYKIQIHTSEVLEDFQGANPPYTLRCKFVVLIAEK